MWGALLSTIKVAKIVNKLKTIKQKRSTTMAANFQSLIVSDSVSSLRIRSVRKRSSLRIKRSSRWALRQECWNNEDESSRELPVIRREPPLAWFNPDVEALQVTYGETSTRFSVLVCLSWKCVLPVVQYHHPYQAHWQVVSEIASPSSPSFSFYGWAIKSSR